MRRQRSTRPGWSAALGAPALKVPSPVEELGQRVGGMAFRGGVAPPEAAGFGLFFFFFFFLDEEQI